LDETWALGKTAAERLHESFITLGSLARVAACVFSGSEGVAFNQKRTNKESP
jgi:hypothetical protein